MKFAFIQVLLASLFSSMKSQRGLALENLALRQQVIMLKRSVKRARPTAMDRIFWIAFSRSVNNWRENLIALHPDTIVRWHRTGFRRYWAWKSRRAGRPLVATELRSLIRRMQSENVTWGAPRIHGELLKLGYDVCEATVSNYMRRYRKPPSQSWRTFLADHREVIAAIDFFTVPSVTFDVLYVFVVIEHARRRVVHFNITAHPTAKWIAQQLTEAFPFESAPKYLIRDGDAKYGITVKRRISALGIKDTVTTPASPWENAYAERVIGSIRRECFDRMIVLNEKHLRRALKEYLIYYHDHRTHLGLNKDAPQTREIEHREGGNVVDLPFLGGLHHRYMRLAA
jgi:transposase InsO family protein